MPLRAYYNEFDPKAAAWLRQLIKNGNITQGEVDERSITEVRPRDLVGFDRVHFFAGIGTWDYCLNESGWGDKPVWTASLPCQPFSAAGKGLGKSDERHLLPHFIELFRECKPYICFGEQVEKAIAHGWLDDLQANMEAEGYAIGHCVLGAHSIGAPHIRQRLYWVANYVNHSCERSIRGIYGEEGGGQTSDRKNITISGELGGASIDVRGMANSNKQGSQGRTRTERTDQQLAGQNGVVEWIYCRDNKYRPIKPSILPLVDGTARGMGYSCDPSAPINPNATQEARTMRLKGYGNAIQAQTAIAFISAFMSV